MPTRHSVPKVQTWLRRDCATPRRVLCVLGEEEGVCARPGEPGWPLATGVGRRRREKRLDRPPARRSFLAARRRGGRAHRFRCLARRRSSCGVLQDVGKAAASGSRRGLIWRETTGVVLRRMRVVLPIAAPQGHARSAAKAPRGSVQLLRGECAVCRGRCARWQSRCRRRARRKAARRRGSAVFFCRHIHSRPPTDASHHLAPRVRPACLTLRSAPLCSVDV